MGFSSYYILNSMIPPLPTSITSHVACIPTPRRRLLLGVTCAIIGLDFAVVGDQEMAIAVDSLFGPTEIVGAQRWSDKRACKPWRVNSLETIVPENLPRPSARRRWESTGLGETAPPVKVAGKGGGRGCFIM